MPRLLSTECIYSEDMDDCFDDYVTTFPIITQQQHASVQHQTQEIPITSAAISKEIANCSNRLPVDDSVKGEKQQEQEIHSISSSDEELLIDHSIVEEEVPNMSSDESNDFEGFDDYTTPNSSGLINDTSREDFNIHSHYLKRHSHTDLNEYHADSGGDIGNEDDANEESAMGGDSKVIYRSKGNISPKRAQTFRYEPFTQNKRKKNINEENYIAKTPALLKTAPDQIVEVNSDSTTNSLKQKRQQINNKLQSNLCQQLNHKTNNNANKCSTESTSEFPVSSPSNPQQPRGGKNPIRPPLLKNTLPADSFERQLAMITAFNPQMTLAEKIQSWDCEEEPSDLEDVTKFDEEFQRLEKQKKLEIKKREKRVYIKNNECKNYDFCTFRQMIINNIKEQKHQKYNTSGQVLTGGPSGVKCVETSGSESSKSVVHVDDRPSTSAVAQQQLQQRRSKHQLCFEMGETKKRVIKDVPKRNQNSTTPPQTSSSDNDRDCFENSKNNTVQRQSQTYATLLCPSSSEEAISQDAPSKVLLKTNNIHAQVSITDRKKSPSRPQSANLPAKSNEKQILTKNSRIVTNEEIQSFFRPHRLNRERDKCNRSPINELEEHSNSIIQMRLDYSNESKTELLLEKKQELFKTPITPQKSLSNSLIRTDYRHQNASSPTKNFKINDETTKESIKENSLAKIDEVNNKLFQEKLEVKSAIDDSDGVYHQQHEFCNYLGLTGMSTATAMANAVAELAQCNLARRSMRVLRQQQQERRDKSAKEQRLLEALKIKELKEIRKQAKGSCDIIPVIATEQTSVLKSDDCSHSQASEPETYFKELTKKTCNNYTAESSTKSEKTYTTIKKEEEVKAFCHTAGKKNVVKKHSSRFITQPIRETLMRQAKQGKSDKLTYAHGGSTNKIESSKINKTERADIVEDPPSAEKENVTSLLKSPVSSSDKSLLKHSRSRSNVLHDQKDTIQSQKTHIVCNLESVCETELLAKSIDIKCATLNTNSEELNIVQIHNEEPNVEEMRLSNSDMRLIPSTPSVIHKKLQMALEESRKSKPSIFIVQSLESKKDKANNLSMECASSPKNVDSVTPLPERYGRREIGNDLKKFIESSAKCNKNEERKVFKTRKGKKYPISKRRLRKRKIIVIKTLKSKHKSYEGLQEIKREFRSSPRTNENETLNCLVKKNENYKQDPKKDKMGECNEAKSFRTVHTETKDLEIYLQKNDNQTKTRLMAKASALLERSRRMTLRGSCLVNNNKLATRIPRSKLNVQGTTMQIFKPRLGNRISERKKVRTSSTVQQLPPTKQITTITNTSSILNLLENENVVVSSTTNTYDEKPSYESLATQSPTALISLHKTEPYATACTPVKTKDRQTQCSVSGVHYLNTPPLPIQTMRNPLKSENGAVLYIYNELDILIVIQEHLVSFWKCLKLVNMLIRPSKLASCTHQTVQHNETSLLKKDLVENSCNNIVGHPALSSTIVEPNDGNEWLQLGELRRLNLDFEISVPYANRICLHNSTPIYLEMRAQQLPKNQRECNLLSIYINIYYYHDEDMIAKHNAIPLDSIQSDVNSVNYTTLTDSRYFIITWPQENLLGKARSGLCKYSLTPQLDTLASIREFKSMRHTIRYLECMSDDKLIGFGETQVSIWDYRSGDVLMNFDFEIPMGRNLGSIYFSSQDIEQNNMLILYQFRDIQHKAQTELMTIACTVTHTQPSYKVLQKTNLPTPAFKVVKTAIKTGDHIVVTGQNDDELWISTTNPRLITVIPKIQDGKRFYSRERSQLIELTDKTLNVNSLANYILQLAAGVASN